MNLRSELENFLQSRRASNRGKRTLEWYEQQISRWLNWLDDEQVGGVDVFDPDLFEEFLNDDRERFNLSDHGVHARFRAARAFLNWLHKRERRRLRKTVLDWDPPTSLIDPPKEATSAPRVARDSDIDRLMAGIRKRSWVDLRDRCLIEALRSCGLRISEACNLLVSDVDISEKFVFVRAGKGQKDRHVPFGERFLSAFFEYRFNRPNVETAHLFIETNRHHKGKAIFLNDNAARQMIRRRCKQVGIDYFNPHSVRHLYAIDALNRGMKADALSIAMGHSSVSFTLRRYAKWQKSGLRNEYDTHLNR